MYGSYSKIEYKHYDVNNIINSQLLKSFNFSFFIDLQTNYRFTRPLKHNCFNFFLKIFPGCF